MLELIRTHRNLFSVIFIVSAAGMVITMFANPSGSRGRGGSLSHGVVARVEDEEITTSALLEVIQRQMEQADRTITEQAKRSGGSPEARKFLESYIKSQITPDRALQSLIQRKFLETSAENLGWSVPPAAIRDRIAEIPAFQDKNGRFDPLLYRERMDRPARFEADVATEAKLDGMRTAFMFGTSVRSDAEMAEDKLLSQRRTFEALTVNPSEFNEPSSVTPAEVAAFTADPANKAKVQSYYERHVREYQRDEEVHARHILIPADKGGEAKAQEILAQIRGGKTTFEKAAKEFSADPSNAGKGGDLGFFGRGMMDPAFEQAAFNLKAPGDLTANPVKSSFGYHLIQLVERRAATHKSIDDVAAEVAPKALLEAKRRERALAWLKGWMSAGKAPSDAELKKYGLKWEKLPEWSPLSESLGKLGPVDMQLGDILKLGKDKPVLAQPITQGENLIALKWVSTSDAPAADTKVAANEPSEAQRKSMEAYEFYLQSRYNRLEKERKIQRSEKVLTSLRDQMKPQS